MQYDFNKRIDRAGTHAEKWELLSSLFGRADLIPLWVADMDLAAPQPVVDALTRRAAHGLYGYTARPRTFFDAAADWQLRRNGWRPDPALMAFGLGVVPALRGALCAFSEQGDEIVYFTPAYNGFRKSIEACGRVACPCALAEDHGRYTVDWAELERMLAKRPPMFVLCSPHNPTGRVWSVEELERMTELCARYEVLVFSDEIHADLTLWGNRHVPTASIETKACIITAFSATKTFNLAGLNACTLHMPDQEHKHRYEQVFERLAANEINCFAAVAMEAAYREGEEWLEQLLPHLEGNLRYVEQFLVERIPEIEVYLPQATYLMWLDCRRLGLAPDALMNFMVNEARLALGDGRIYEGPGFMRMNVACPRGMLEQALFQLEQAVTRLRGSQIR